MLKNSKILFMLSFLLWSFIASAAHTVTVNFDVELNKKYINDQLTDISSNPIRGTVSFLYDNSKTTVNDRIDGHYQRITGVDNETLQLTSSFENLFSKLFVPWETYTQMDFFRHTLFSESYAYSFFNKTESYYETVGNIEKIQYLDTTLSTYDYDLNDFSINFLTFFSKSKINNKVFSASLNDRRTTRMLPNGSRIESNIAWRGTATISDVIVTPLPSGFWLMGSALLVLIGLVQKSSHKTPALVGVG
jgi:hypothetical protein